MSVCWLNGPPGTRKIWRRMQSSDVKSLPTISIRLTIAGFFSSISHRRLTVGTESGPVNVRSTTGRTVAYR